MHRYLLRHRLFASLSALALLAVACGSGDGAVPGSPGEASNSQPSGEAAPPSAPAVRMHAELETAASVAALIGPDGGELSTTAADGTTYTLVVAADALAATTEISMTPVSAATGLPDAVAWQFGVELAPSGLVLAMPAVLTIEHPGVGDVEFVGYQGAERALYLTEAVVEPGRARLPVAGFSGRGGVSCTGSCAAAGIGPRSSSSTGGTYGAARDAIRNAVEDLQRRQLAGENEPDDLWDEAADALADALRQAEEECRPGGDIDQVMSAAMRLTSLVQMAQLTGLDERVGEVDLGELLDACLRFEFELDARFDDGEPSIQLATEHLYARFPLQREETVFVGEGPFEIIDAYIARPGLGCTVGLQPDMRDGDMSEPVKVLAMRFVFTDTPDDDLQVHDVELWLMPGWVQMHQSEPCVVTNVTIHDVSSFAYAGGWDDLHADELVQHSWTDYFFRITGWDIRHSGGVVAEKRYQRSAIVHTVPLAEDTTLRILFAR